MRLPSPCEWLLLGLAGVCCPAGAQSDAPALGEVVSRRGEGLIRSAGQADWDRLATGRTLAPGDVVRTGRYGKAAIVFVDDTQVRLQPDSELRVHSVRGFADAEQTVLDLETGSLWSRAESVFRRLTGRVTPGRNFDNVQIRTPIATIGIRGTDWHVGVAPGGRSELTVLSGTARLATDTGEVLVSRGEIGIAEAGAAPVKRLVVDLRDRPLIGLNLELEWLDLLALVPPGISADGSDTPLRRAETAYDAGDYAGARALLGAAPASGTDTGRVVLLEALLDARAHAFVAAESRLAQAGDRLQGRARAIATLAAAGLAFELQRYDQAEAVVATLLREHADLAEAHLVNAWLLSARGNHDEAIAALGGQAERHPGDARFPSLLAALYFLTDRPQPMRAALDAALATDPRCAYAWYVEGRYHHFVAPHAARALAAYRRAVELRPGYAAAWNELGLVLFALGDYQGATAAMEAAVRAEPASAVWQSSLGYLLAALGRLDRAQTLFDRARAAGTNVQYGLVGAGLVDLLRGRPDAAADEFLAASAVDPQLPGLNAYLASAYYQAEHVDEAHEALATARRLDADDPVPDILGSIMAVDNFRAADAIRYARSGFAKTLKAESFAVENLANAKSGSATLGYAFTNLGLHEWGGYYTQLAFDPYLANGYFYLSDANQFQSEDARIGANRQGLLLDPTAVSFPTRFFEPYRQPRRDLSLYGSVGSSGGALAYDVSGTVQSFARVPDPLAYYFSASRTRDDGFRANNDSTAESAFLLVGSSLGERRHNLLFSLDARRFRNGVPGPSNAHDPDDRFTDEFMFLSLGYQYRMNFHNRLMLRVFGGLEHSESLSVADSVFPIDTSFTCLTLCNSERDDEDHVVQLQLRHLLDLGPVELTWGAEIGEAREHTDVTTLVPGFVPPARYAEFRSFNVAARQFYVQGRWKPRPDVWIDAGLFRRSLTIEGRDPDFFGTIFTSRYDEQQTDPRLGLAWRFLPGHWLRVAAQRKLVFPQRASETLAPVDTVGLVVADFYFSSFSGGESARDLRVRWDAEWLPWLFTWTEYEYQRIANFQRQSFLFDKATVELATLGANVHILDDFGLRVSHSFVWNEDKADGLELPGIEDSFASVDLTWVDPRFLRAGLSLRYTGERYNDLLNTDRLDGYWTTGLFANWQPLRKHWSFTLQVQDVFNAAPEFSRYFPTAGRSAYFSVEYRL
ncbi:MAG: tetratricopeptide repeat protein [Gammaproteobacteria bacterium]|nr:tetratricopeptide repeat protein [Gammaproteobacteria bacterium]